MTTFVLWGRQGQKMCAIAWISRRKKLYLGNFSPFILVLRIIGEFYLREAHYTIKMNRLYPAIVCVILLTNCLGSTQQEHKEVKNNISSTPRIAESKGVAKEGGTTTASKETPKDDKATDKPALKATAVQSLITRLGKGVKLEYSELDKEILRNDTLVRTKHGDYQISYTTACLNDSLVALEMYNYEAGYSKSYRLLHNYQTNINMNHNGKPSGARVISKDIFKNKMQPDFLEKAIIKHPQFVRFDEERNEAIFQFLVGVPATDYVVLAGVNLSPRGEIRIIDVTMPRFE